MIFSEESVKAILSGKKTQTRRLVTPNHEISEEVSSEMRKIIGVRIRKKLWEKKGKKGNPYTNIYWIGQDYAVQLGRGKKGLWYCDNCKKFFTIDEEYDKERPLDDFRHIKYHSKCVKELGLKKPLRVQIVSIKKERLLDISEADAKKEGYKTRLKFWQRFKQINYNTYKKDFKYKNSVGGEYWNPFVWVLEIKTLGGVVE